MQLTFDIMTILLPLPPASITVTIRFITPMCYHALKQTLTHLPTMQSRVCDVVLVLEVGIR